MKTFNDFVSGVKSESENEYDDEFGKNWQAVLSMLDKLEGRMLTTADLAKRTTRFKHMEGQLIKWSVEVNKLAQTIQAS